MFATVPTTYMIPLSIKDRNALLECVRPSIERIENGLNLIIKDADLSRKRKIAQQVKQLFTYQLYGTLCQEPDGIMIMDRDLYNEIGELFKSVSKLDFSDKVCSLYSKQKTEEKRILFILRFLSMVESEINRIVYKNK